MFFLPCADVWQQLLDNRLVRNEIVVDNENDFHSLCPQRIQLGDDLGGRLEPRLPPESDNDVAEFALERASAGKLNAAEQVLPQRL